MFSVSLAVGIAIMFLGFLRASRQTAPAPTPTLSTTVLMLMLVALAIIGAIALKR